VAPSRTRLRAGLPVGALLLATLGWTAFDHLRPEHSPMERGVLAARALGCHGDLGQGGARNPGSLKGYVPGFFGRDYDLLTRDGDPEVLREWIRDGEPGFFHRGVSPLRLGPWFTARQQVKMPGYARTLRREEVEMLVAYLGLLRGLGPLDAEGVARYRALRSLPALGPGA
jgi:mono/diheme cytochrome c family protein